MATQKPKGLGRGLESLLGPRLDGDNGSDPSASDFPNTLALGDLVPGAYQPRTRMDEGALYELAESIKAQGIMQPILVRRLETADGLARLAALQSARGEAVAVRGARPVYEIIAGERRFHAARLAGLESVPVLVREVPDEAAAAMALIENIQRENLNPLEEAQGLQRLVSEFGLTHELAAQAVGRSRSAASNLLRLLHLAEPVQQLLLAGDVDMGHARALLALDGAQQISTANQVAAKKLSVRETERLVQKLDAKNRTPGLARALPEKPRDLLRLEEELSDRLAAKVEIRLKNRVARNGRKQTSGELLIHFGSLDELNGLIDRIGGADNGP